MGFFFKFVKSSSPGISHRALHSFGPTTKDVSDTGEQVFEHVHAESTLSGDDLDTFYDW